MTKRKTIFQRLEDWRNNGNDARVSVNLGDLRELWNDRQAALTNCDVWSRRCAEILGIYPRNNATNEYLSMFGVANIPEVVAYRESLLKAARERDRAQRRLMWYAHAIRMYWFLPAFVAHKLAERHVKAKDNA